MVKDLVAVGTGGQELARIIEDINSFKKTYNFIGWLEKDTSKIGTELMGYPIIGNDDLLLTECKHCAVVNNAMANPRIHETVTNNLVKKYHVNDFPNIVHPDVDMRGVEIGYGNVINRYARLWPLCKIGNFNMIYSGTVGHEVIVGDYNLIATCLIGSRAVIGSYNLLGNNSSIVTKVKIGDDNEIGFGTVVMKNVKNGHQLLGYPAIEAEDFVHYYMSRKR